MPNEVSLSVLIRGLLEEKVDRQGPEPAHPTSIRLTAAVREWVESQPELFTLRSIRSFCVVSKE
ncbi:MAG: hypothetical protein JOY54_18885 [Acidobacteriaceae bacterium]|nr:hypothetical protein [Acidobacteriaceae bacterium]